MVVRYILDFLKFNESLEWGGSLMGSKVGDLASHSDGYFKMVVKDVNFDDNDNMLLTVHFQEVNNSKFNGGGIFKYVKSNIDGLSGDIIPIEINGILEDVFDEDSETIYEFINILVDQLI